MLNKEFWNQIKCICNKLKPQTTYFEPRLQRFFHWMFYLIGRMSILELSCTKLIQDQMCVCVCLCVQWLTNRGETQSPWLCPCPGMGWSPWWRFPQSGLCLCSTFIPAWQAGRDLWTLQSVSSAIAKGLNTCVNGIFQFFLFNTLQFFLKSYFCFVIMGYWS